jgi:putative aldouronate transport system substrate-binding protein
MRKLILVLLAVILANSLFGRGSQSSAPSSSTPGSTAPITFDIWVDFSWFWYDRYEGKEVADRMREISGVNLNMTKAVDSTQLPIMIAANSLPDFVYASNTNSIAGLSDPNVCWPMNELTRTYNVDIKASAVDIANNTFSDGNYYTIKNLFIPQESYSSGEVAAGLGLSAISYRLDIYEAIGRPQFNNLDDLENALLAAKARYPNIVPLLNDGGVLGYIYQYFMRQLGIPAAAFQYDSRGNVIHIISNPDLLKYYELMNRYYRQGLISLEAQTYNYERFQDVRNSGMAFMLNRSSGEASEANSALIASRSNYRFKLIDHNLGDNPVEYDTGIGWAGLFITKKNKDPRRAIEYFAWHRLPETKKLTTWGIEGRHWAYNERGETIRLPWYNEAIAAGGTQFDFAIGTWIFGVQSEEAAWFDHNVKDQDILDDYNLRKETAGIIRVLPELYFAMPTSGDMRNTYTRITDLFTTASNEIIFANTEAEMRAAYNRMVTQARGIGLAQLEQWSNDAVRRQLGR